MAKINPNRKNQKSLGSQKNRAHNLPPEILARGIATQLELVLALLPYMEWIRFEKLREVFWKYITHHRTDGPLRGYICVLKGQRLLEVRYEGQPKTFNGSPMKLSGYLYVRRISREKPKSLVPSARAIKLKGMYGFRAEKERARQAKNGKKKKAETAAEKLTVEDLEYMRNAPEEMNNRQLAEMFTITINMAKKVRKGYTPAHLRERPAQ